MRKQRKVTGSTNVVNMTRHAVAMVLAMFSGSVLNGAVIPEIDDAGNYTFTVEGTETYSDVIGGTGITVTKLGSGKLTLSGANTFTGTIMVKEGTLAASPTATGGKPALVVETGATFSSAGGGSTWGANPLNLTSITVAGHGVGGQGAFIRESGTTCRSATQPTFKLAGDATVNFKINHNLGAVNLNGYTLTKIGAATWEVYNCASNFVPDGDGGYGKIVVKQGYFQVQQLPLSVGGADNVLELAGGTYATIAFKKTQPCKWKVLVTADSFVRDETASAAGYTCLSGPVEISGGNLKLANKNASSTIEFTGDITSSSGRGIMPNYGSSNNAGTFRFSGKSIDIKGDLGDGSSAKRNALQDLVFEGSSMISRSGNTNLAGDQTTPQTLSILDATWTCSGTKRIIAGSNYSWGRVEQSNSVVTNGVRLGGYYTATATSYGMYRQAGGELAVPSGTDMCLVGDSIGAGFYVNYGGLLNVLGESRIGRIGTGSMYFFGGKADFAGTVSMAIGRTGDNLTDAQKMCGFAAYYQSGASTNRVLSFDVGPSSASVPAGSAVIAAEGAGTLLEVYGTGSSQGLRLLAADDLVVAVNNGAVLSATRIQRANAVADAPNARFSLSVDGGTLVHSTATTYTEGVMPDNVLVQAGGMTLSAAADGTLAWPAAFTAPSGKIVSEISLPTSDAFLALQGTYIGPPKVTISGAGTGAAAIALFDVATRTVTGIRVVSPGTGYDENTTATINPPTASNPGTASGYECSVTLADAPTTGAGFVKQGKGTYTFARANTYNGPTKVEGGTLVFANASSLPAGSGLAVSAGATADLDGKTFTVPTLEGAGTVADGSLVATSSVTLAMMTNSALQVEGSLTLGDGAAVLLTGSIADLDPDKSNVLLSAAGGIVCEGALSVPSLPAPWAVLVRAKTITVGRLVGTTIMIK